MPHKTLDEYLKSRQTQTIERQPQLQQERGELKYKIIEFYRETQFQEIPVGKIPKEWRIVKIKDIALIIRNGLTYRNYNRDGEGYPIARIETISEGKIDIAKIAYVKDVTKEDLIDYRLQVGDILFSHINSIEHVGKAALYEGKPELLLHGMNLLLIRPNTKLVSPLFLLYLINCYRDKGVFARIAKRAVNQASINQTQLSNIKITLPPLEEQWGIAEVLSSVDRAIEAADRLIQKLEHVKKALMQELLTKGIGHKEYQETPIGKIPNKWKIVRLSDVARVDAKGIEPRPGARYYYLSLEDIESNTGRILKQPDHLIDGAEIRSTKYVFTANHVLYGKLRPYLNKVALPFRDGICSTDILPLLPNTRLILREYLAYILLHQHFVEYATARMKGTNHPRIRPQDVLEYKFPLPPIEEQQQITSILKSIGDWIELEAKRKEKLEVLKRGLMDLLLSGVVRVKVVALNSNT